MSSTPNTPRPDDQPEPKTDDVLALEASAGVLECAIRLNNPYTKALFLEAAAELYREYAVLIGAVAPMPPHLQHTAVDE